MGGYGGYHGKEKENSVLIHFVQFVVSSRNKSKQITNK